MEWFWLSIGTLIVLVVTVMGFQEGFNRWVFYYALAALAFAYYFLRRFMRRRMEKHIQWMEEEKKRQQGKA